MLSERAGQGIRQRADLGLAEPERLPPADVHELVDDLL
jgi:hypothetical protein